MSNEEKNNGFNRVVITGMGAISPAGFGVDAPVSYTHLRAHET